MNIRRSSPALPALVTTLLLAIFLPAQLRGQSTALGRLVRPSATQSVSAAGEESVVTSLETAPQPVEKSGPAPAVDSEEKAQEQQKKAQRLQQVQQLVFDRRPSTILKTWASLPADEETSESDANDGAASAVKAEPGHPGPPKPPDPPMPPMPPPAADTFNDELKAFPRHVTLGEWKQVKQILLGWDQDVSKAAYRRLLQVLQSPPGQIMPVMDGMDPEQVQLLQMQFQAMQGVPQQMQERNRISFEDVLGLAEAVPHELDDSTLGSLGRILRLAIEQGSLVEELLVRFKNEVAKPADLQAINRRQAAQLLFHCGQSLQLVEFLPAVDEAIQENDFDGLNLLARYFLAKYDKNGKTEDLEQAWTVTQSVLSSQEIKKKDKNEALTRAVELAPKIRNELGQTWLEQSFTEDPRRGMEILAAIGAAASTSMQMRAGDIDSRLKSLQLQTTAVEALLKHSPDRAREWQEPLTLLATNWLKEAEHSYRMDQSTSLGPIMRRDPFGNLYYANYGDEDPYANQMGTQQQVRALKTADILEIKPSDQWIALTDAPLRPKFSMVYAQLYLKVSEDEKAFPYVEQLAKSHPDQGKRLVDEFLRVWTNNHDPNATRNRTNYYMFMYGYERRAESIPLTRSKQQRNLEELAELVQRLQQLPIGDLNNELLARAFTTCHSSAEVYQLDAIRRVFGPIESLKPETLAELSQQMRANLAGLWRVPEVQQQNQTNRKQKDIQAEVLRGYTVARTVLDDALLKHPDNWQLELAKAALEVDENNYMRELGPSSSFSEIRDQALARFRRAAELYAQTVPELKLEEETTKAYELWFYASLGAADLPSVDETKVADPRQAALIRDAILALPGEAAERHMARFANTLFTRMSSAKPQIKYAYLKTGFDIVGDHKSAYEARKVLDYYKDLVTEIKLETVIDGSDNVGHGQPFGVFVNLRHTREIERESGGFGRYLQNQNNQRYAYNYGRPTENYRDKFQEVATQALQEHFEVLSVTFQSEDVNSRAIAGEYGWRYTPYAYILLKARSPAVDKLPPLRLDLDFLDTSGYAILPIESPALPIDAKLAEAPPRPVAKLEVVQILDERQAAQGKLILEVKATARGLVPKLEALLEFPPQDFIVDQVDDLGVSVSRFDAESPENLMVCERTWLMTWRAKENLAERPQSFTFGTAAEDEIQLVLQRYVDADLAAAEPVLSLEQAYGRPRRLWWPYAALVAGLLVVGGGACCFWFGRSTESLIRERFEVPAEINAFTVLGLLRRIQQNNELNEAGHQELTATIHRLERYYFASENGDHEPDLRDIASAWVHRTS
jgi:hypothetical protein